jgi:hypothetical protein
MRSGATAATGWGMAAPVAAAVGGAAFVATKVSPWLGLEMCRMAICA